MEIDKNNQCHRTLARGIQAADQDANRPAKRRNRRHAFLGLARVRTDRDAEGRRLAKPIARSLPIKRLTLPHDPINSTRWRLPQANFNIDCERTL